MSRTIQNFIDDIDHELGGAGSAEIVNLYNLMYITGLEVLRHISPKELILEEPIINGVFAQLEDYTCPTKMYENRVLKIYKPFLYQNQSDKFISTNSNQFKDQDVLERNRYSIEYKNGIKILRIRNNSVGNSSLLHSFDTTNANGTITVTGDATTASNENFDFLRGSGAVKVVATPSLNQVTLTLNTENVYNLKDLDSSGALSLFIKPSSDVISNIVIRWGNDSSNYYSRTLTSGQFQEFAAGYNLLVADWANSTETGSVNNEAIDWFQIIVNYTGSSAVTFLFDNLMAHKGEQFWVNYLNKYLFQNSNGTWLLQPTSDTDLIMLDDSAYQIYKNQFLHEYTVGHKIDNKLVYQNNKYYRYLFTDKQNGFNGAYENYNNENGGLEMAEEEDYTYY